MPKEIKNLQDLVNRYRYGCGEPLTALAEEAGVSRQTLKRVFGELGCLDLDGKKVKPKRKKARKPRQKIQVDNLSELASRYLAGEPLEGLAEGTGLGASTLKVRMLEAGHIRPGQRILPSPESRLRLLSERVPVDRVIRLYEQNISITEIARIVQRDGFPEASRDNVKAVLVHSGVYRKGRGGGSVLPENPGSSSSPGAEPPQVQKK
jgi:hypothetical protein